MLVVGGIALPFLMQVSRQQQVLACQNNLRLLHRALFNYGDLHDGAFPKIEVEPPKNVAGMVIPMLNDSGLLHDGLPLDCPPRKPGRNSVKTVQELEDLQAQDPDGFRRLVSDLAGSYAYTLGYQKKLDNEWMLFGLCQQDDNHLPIMSDRPHSNVMEGANSPNHGYRGQNVLYIGGNARFANSRLVGVNGDDIFLNHHKHVAAGDDLLDTVLGSSSASPFPFGDQ